MGSEATLEEGNNQAQAHRSDVAASEKISAAQKNEAQAADSLQLDDFLGQHGAYQMSLTLLLFIRYVFLGLMANSGPLMTPDVTFYCKLPEREIMMIMPNITLMSEQERELEIKEEFKQICQIDLHLYRNQSFLLATSGDNRGGGGGGGNQGKNSSHSSVVQSNNFKTTSISAPSSIFGGNKQAGKSGGLRGNNATSQPASLTTAEQASDYFANRIRECTEFTYQLARDQGRTMTSEFDLVCDRDWLRSLFQSLLSAAIVVAHVFWGTFSDKYGRFQAQRICLVVSFTMGLLSIFAWDFWSFTLARALCSFGDLGLVVSMTTTLVELVGSKYRGCSVALVNFGYALGVSLLPYIVAYFEDFRLVIGFTVLCHMITMPLVLATNESVRWLLTNRRFKSAKRELKRIVRWNRRFHELGPIFKCCTLTGGSKSLSKCNDDDGGDDRNLNEKRTSSSTPSRRKQKREFERKFEEFIKQIESQNLCDPIVSELSVNCAALSPRGTSPRGTPTLLRQTNRTPPRAAKDKLEAPTLSFTNPGASHLAQRGWFFGTPPLIITTPPDAGNPEEIEADIHREPAAAAPPPKPRLLENLDLEQLRRIKEVEEIASSAGALSTSHTSNSSGGGGGGGHQRSHSGGGGGLLNEALIRSLEMRHQQRLFPDDSTQTKTMATLTLPHSSISRASSVESQLSNLGRLSSSASLSDLRRHYASDHHYVTPQKPPDCINLVAHQLSFVGRVSRLFKDKKLMIAVFTIVWTTFNSELLYTSFIIINLEVGEDLYLNYVLGGCMEALAAIMASLLLSYSPRRISLITFWLLISFACFGLSLAHIDSTWAVWMLALAKFSQSCLSSIATVAAYESFPTFLRQSGSGLVFTLGMLGSVFAPLIFAEFDDHAGMDRVLMTFSVSSLTAATLIYLCLTETRNCELM